MHLPAIAPNSPGTRRAAQLITEVTAPVVLAATLLIAVALHSANSTSTAIATGVVAAVFAAAIPLTVILSGARRGRWSTHHVNEREHRPRVLAIALGSLAVGLVILTATSAPRELLVLLTAMGAGLASVLLVSKVWKVSIHAAVAGGTTVVLAATFGPWLIAFGLVAGAAAWSRVILSDHTTAQVLVGLILGAAVAAAVFLPLR